jgi:hypothetical protein
MMMEHPAFGQKGGDGDFIAETETGIDPFIAVRRDNEPKHSITNIEYGHVGKAENLKPDTKMSADQMANVKKIAAELAVSMLKDMLPTAVENEIKKREGNIVKEETFETYDSVEGAENDTRHNNDVFVPEPIEDDSVLPDYIEEETQSEPADAKNDNKVDNVKKTKTAANNKASKTTAK